MEQKSLRKQPLSVHTATILINKLGTLPDAVPDDSYWTLAQLVNRRENVVRDLTRLKNQLHELLVNSYPSYKSFFTVIDRPTALYFWENYPSPMHLKGITAEKLAEELRPISHNQCSTKRAQKILDAVKADGKDDGANSQRQWYSKKSSFL